MGNAGRARVQREFTETAMIDGFERAVNAAGDRTQWTNGSDRDGHRAGGDADETSDVRAPRGVRGAARRGGGDGAAELHARRRVGERIGAARLSRRSKIRRAVVERQLTVVVSGEDRATRSSASRARRTDISDARAIETAVLPSYSRAQILDLFEEVNGWSIVEERLARGKGLIVVTGHLGNWELGGAYLAARGVPIDAVARHMDNPLFDAYLTATRERIGMTVVHDDEAVRRVPRSLRVGPRGRVSRRSGRGRTGVDVGAVLRPLREDAARAGGVRAAARRAGRVRRRAAPAVGPLSADLRADRRAATPAIARPTSIASSPITRATLERWVRRAPEQYLWHHRRWKHQRPGTPPELGDPS